MNLLKDGAIEFIGRGGTIVADEINRYAVLGLNCRSIWYGCDGLEEEEEEEEEEKEEEEEVCIRLQQKAPLARKLS